MKNKMSIRAENKNYASFGEILEAFKGDTVVSYYLVVNDEEVEISHSMAFGMTAFFDEYNREVCKIDQAI